MSLILNADDTLSGQNLPRNCILLVLYCFVAKIWPVQFKLLAIIGSVSNWVDVAADAKESQCPRTSLESKNPGIITLADSCKYDFPNGFVQTTFFQPENPRFPDYVTFSVAPDVRLYYNIEKDPRYDVSMLGPKKHSPIVVELKARLVNMKSVHDQAPKYQVLLINNNMTFTLTRPDESFRMIPTLNMTGSPVPVDISINRTYCRDENRGCVVKVRLEIPVINRQGTVSSVSSFIILPIYF